YENYSGKLQLNAPPVGTLTVERPAKHHMPAAKPSEPVVAVDRAKERYRSSKSEGDDMKLVQPQFGGDSDEALGEGGAKSSLPLPPAGAGSIGKSQARQQASSGGAGAAAPAAPPPIVAMAPAPQRRAAAGASPPLAAQVQSETSARLT